MLSFIKKINQNHIENDKIKKYFMYVLGEIAVVMIGILLALQVNNWNNDRIESIKEKKILAGIYTTLSEDLVLFESNLEKLYQSERELPNCRKGWNGA